LTLIVEADDDTVGLRIPDLPWLLALINQLDRPLVATSANAPGVDPAISMANGYRDLPEQPDFIISGPSGGGAASTVCRMEPFEILREGPVSAPALASVIGQGSPVS
jgi:L-threonylcarbamoyladenylate synthase